MSNDPFSFLSSIGEVDTDTSFPVLPAGLYRSRIDGRPEVKRNKKNNGSYLNIQWKPLDEPDFPGKLFQIISIPLQPGSPDWKAQLADESGKYHNDEKKLKEAQDTVVKMFFAWFEDVTGDNYGDPSTRPPIDLGALAGRTAILTVIEEEWEGRPKNTVKSVSPDTDGVSAVGTTSTSQRRAL